MAIRGKPSPYAPLREPFLVSAAEVKAFQAEHECGMEYAKICLVRAKLVAAVHAATTFDELKPIVLAMLVMPEI